MPTQALKALLDLLLTVLVLGLLLKWGYFDDDCEVAGGVRSAWGAHDYASPASLIQTAQLRGCSAVDPPAALTGRMALRYLTSPARE